MFSQMGKDILETRIGYTFGKEWDIESGQKGTPLKSIDEFNDTGFSSCLNVKNLFVLKKRTEVKIETSSPGILTQIASGKTRDTW